MAAAMGYPIGYMTAQASLTFSDNPTPAADALIAGIVGAIAGFVVGNSWPTDKIAGGECKVRELLTPGAAIMRGIKKEDQLPVGDPHSIFCFDDIKKDTATGAVVGGIFGVLGTVASGSSGGSDKPDAATTLIGIDHSTNPTPSGMLLTSGKVPVIHTVIAGAMSAAMVGMLRTWIHAFAGGVTEQASKAKAKLDDAHDFIINK